MGNFEQEVKYINGVWSIKFIDLVELLKVAPEHHYQQRVSDKKGNAKSSFVLDIRNPNFNKLIWYIFIEYANYSMLFKLNTKVSFAYFN